MGCDKALLPHPHGGTWLEHALRQLAALQVPITVLSRHAAHRELAEAWARRQGLVVEAIAEPPPWEGPLLALQRLVQRYPTHRLLICPVDMPALNGAALETLLSASVQQPALIHLAHDGMRLQPLLAVIPADSALALDLAQGVAQGQRRLQGWLLRHPHRLVGLQPHVVSNMNDPTELSTAVLLSASAPAPPQS